MPLIFVLLVNLPPNPQQSNMQRIVLSHSAGRTNRLCKTKCDQAVYCFPEAWYAINLVLPIWGLSADWPLLCLLLQLCENKNACPVEMYPTLHFGFYPAINSGPQWGDAWGWMKIGLPHVSCSALYRGNIPPCPSLCVGMSFRFGECSASWVMTCQRPALRKHWCLNLLSICRSDGVISPKIIWQRAGIQDNPESRKLIDYRV